MRIFQVIARVNQGGTASWLETLVDGLRGRGHQVDLFAGFVEEFEHEDACFERLLGRRIIGLSKSIAPMADIKSIIAFRKILKSEVPDVINTHTSKAGVIGRIAAFGLPVRVIHTYHGHTLHGYFSKYKSTFFAHIEKQLAHKTDVIIAVGKKVMDELVQAGIGNQEQYKVIYPGIKKIDFESRSKARILLSIGEEDIVVGWLGRLTKIKVPEKVLSLAAEFPETQFIIGGDGELMASLKSLLPSNVRMLGWVDPKIFWPACDLGILTSLNEGLPTAIIEAQLASIPVVSFNVGSVGEIVENGKSGYICNTDSEFKIRFAELIADPKRQVSMGTSGLQRCSSLFEVERFIDAHLSIYKS